MVSLSVLSTNMKQVSPQSVRFHVNIQQARTAVGSAMRFACFDLFNGTEIMRPVFCYTEQLVS